MIWRDEMGREIRTDGLTYKTLRERRRRGRLNSRKISEEKHTETGK